MEYLKTNWFLILAAVILIWNLVKGFRKGFVRMMYRILSTVLAVIAAAFLVEPFGNFLQDNTGLYEWIEKHCQNAFAAFGTGNTVIDGLLNSSGASAAAGQTVAQLIFRVTVFLIAFLLIRLCFWIIMKILEGVMGLPVLHGINRFFGLLTGGVNALLIIWLLMFAASYFQNTEIGQSIMACTEGNEVLKNLYEMSPLQYVVDIFA